MQGVNDIIEKQVLTIESCDKVMLSMKRKRGLLSESINVDWSSKKPKNLVESQLIATRSEREGAETIGARNDYFILSNGLPPSLREYPKLKLLIEGENHLPNWHKTSSSNLLTSALLDAYLTAIINNIDSQ